MDSVITYLPNRDYDDLYATVKLKQRYSERFGSDSVDTQMWMHDGKLLSQMKGELLIKQIKPMREMNIAGLTGASGFAKSVLYLVNTKGLPFEQTSEFLLHLYSTQKIPKWVELPTHILDSMMILTS